MDFRRADLHTHTRCSDGRFRPDELVRRAREAGIQALSVTDHDCIEGIADAAEEGRRSGVEVVPGIELSITVGLREAHLLGYFFDPSHAGLRRHLERFRSWREHRVEQIVRRLNALDVPIRLEQVHAEADGGILGRPHVASAMVRNGHADTNQDAFEAYLREGGPAFVAKPPFPAEEALALLHSAGGIGVLAHPGHWTGDAALSYLVRSGLDGIESVHPSHDYTLRQYYRRKARELNLIETGGSDYHGFRDIDDQNLGRYSIPYAQFEGIRRRAA